MAEPVNPLMMGNGEDYTPQDRQASWNKLLRDPVRTAVETPQPIERNAANLYPRAPDQGPIQSPLGFGEPLANRLPPGTMDILAGLIGPRAPVRVPNPIKAYHGSPHDFDAFDLSKIGTGEGAQAYGHGLYFAEHEPVARQYRDAFERRAGPTAGVVNDWVTTGQSDLARETLSAAGGDIEAAIAKARSAIDKGGRLARVYADVPAELETIRSYGKLPPPARMYEVALHASPEQFLDWDKPLAGQGDAARSAFEKAFSEAAAKSKYPVPLQPDNPMSEHIQSFGNALAKGATPHDTRYELQPSYPEAVSGRLREAGIPGVRYLDQGSRQLPPKLFTSPEEAQAAAGPGGKAVSTRTGWITKLMDADARVPKWVAQRQHGDFVSSGPQTSNYVIWSPEIIEILRKYGLIGAAPLAGAAMTNVLSQPSPTQQQ